MSVQQPTGAIRSLPTGTIADQVFSVDGKTLYTTRNGTITAYDVASGAAVNSWTLGTKLGGIDVSADGKYLVATEQTTGSSTGGTYSSDKVTNYSVYRLDLSTGTSTTYNLPLTGQYTSPYYDVSYLPDGKILLSNGGQWTPLTTFDFATGAKTTFQSLSSSPTIVRSQDHVHDAILQSNISDASLLAYTAGVGVVGSHGGYQDNVQGFNTGVEAVSPTGDVIVQGLGLNVYDGQLHFQQSLATRYPQWSGSAVRGLVFDPSGSKLYLLDGAANEVYVLDTKTWNVLAGYSIGTQAVDAGPPYSPGYGDGLQISADGHTLAVTGSVSVQLLDLTKLVNDGGTSGNDTLTGDSAANVIYGFEGNDVIDGGAGADQMYGGPGDDKYYVDNISDQVIEYAGQGNDTVYSSVSYTLPANVETLVLTGTAAINATGSSTAGTLIGNDAANVLTGGSGDDVLIGNGGNDTLNGGTGNDRMVGGTGDDTYYVDSPADTVVEAAGEGNDLVYTGITYTLPANVERLILTGANSVNGIGNDLANQITGNSADNVLSGLGGDDILTGGLGNDTIDGGAGVDTAVFASTLAGTMVSFAADGSVVVTGSDGRDTLLNVEKLAFSNGTLDVAASAPVGALYAAWGGRDASAAELAYWTGQLATGAATLAGIRTAILADPLGVNHTNAVVTQLYQNLGGRAPSADELATWRGQIAGGAGFDTVRAAILADPLGAQAKAVAALYAEYMGRAASDGELGVWVPQVKAGLALAAVRGAILDDASGRAHTDATVTQLYQNFGGRAPTAAELTAWEGNVRAGGTFADVRHAILADPLGSGHTADVVTGLYQTYGGRAPTAGELQTWQANVLAGASYDDVRHAILADPLGTGHTNAVVAGLYQAEFGRAASSGDLATWQSLIGAGATFDTLLDTLIADHGSDATGTQRLAGTSAADAFMIGHGHETVVTGFDAAHDTITLARTDVASGNPLDAAHARQIYALDGTPDVLLTLDDGHHVLLQHSLLADLTASSLHLA